MLEVYNVSTIFAFSPLFSTVHPVTSISRSSSAEQIRHRGRQHTQTSGSICGRTGQHSSLSAMTLRNDGLTAAVIYFTAEFFRRILPSIVVDPAVQFERLAERTRRDATPREDAVNILSRSKRGISKAIWV
jgi:hypothetical protein